MSPKRQLSHWELILYRLTFKLSNVILENNIDVRKGDLSQIVSGRLLLRLLQFTEAWHRTKGTK